ncbi:MAG: PEGA domain-containing protein [Myxococcales bacterium]|nr:PEGA domain-containing protein [Myxococcales bacterium]
MRVILRSLVVVAPLLLLASGVADGKPRKKKPDPMEAVPDIAPLPDKKAPGAASAIDPKTLHSLTVECAPPGADVFVDGQMIGNAPIEMPVPVTAGDHTIKVVKLGYAPFIDVFSAKTKKVVKLEIELVPISGVLHVTANITGARVLIDGRYVGEAPVHVEMDVGARAVQVEKGCYKEFFSNVLAVAGKDDTIDVKLIELPQDETNPCYVKPLPPAKWFQKKWVWGVLAGAVVLVAGGTVGAIFGTQKAEFCSTTDACFNLMTSALATW